MQALWFLLLYFSLRKRRFLQKFLDSDLWEFIFEQHQRLKNFCEAFFTVPPIPFREFLIRAEMQVQAPKTV